jgi:hypothetical protein
MVFSEKDWVLLRARLRYFVELKSLPRMKSVRAASPSAVLIRAMVRAR